MPSKLPVVIAPLVTVMSAATKSVTGSEKVAVIGMGEVPVGLVTVEVMATVGAIVSFVTVIAADQGPMFPAPSVALASTDIEPSAKVVASTVMLNAPAASAVPVAVIVIVSVNLTSTVEPGSA